MEATQSFGLVGETDIEQLRRWAECCQLDIERVFPGVKHVKDGSVAVKRMRNLH
jgi:hypothetical protein